MPLKRYTLSCGVTADVCIAQCEFGPGAKPQNVDAAYRTWEQISDNL
jgi:hypothetical protein